MFVNFSLGITRESFQLSNRFWVEQSSYSAMLNIAEPVPTIPEFVNSNSQPCIGIPSYSGMAQKRNSQEFPGIPELQELIPSRCDSGIPYRNRLFILEVSL
jgi:hypothetical protein